MRSDCLHTSLDGSLIKWIGSPLNEVRSFLPYPFMEDRRVQHIVSELEHTVSLSRRGIAVSSFSPSLTAVKPTGSRAHHSFLA